MWARLHLQRSLASCTSAARMVTLLPVLLMTSRPDWEELVTTHITQRSRAVAKTSTMLGPGLRMALPKAAPERAVAVGCKCVDAVMERLEGAGAVAAAVCRRQITPPV